MFRRHPILTVVTLGYLGLVAVVTLGPAPQNSRDSIIFRVLELVDRVPGLGWVSYNLLEFLANIAMFMPLGLFLVLLFGRRLWWLSILIAVALTFLIETAQQLLPTRVSDPRDIVANSVGATLGVLVALVVTAGKAKRLRKAAPVARSSSS